MSDPAGDDLGQSPATPAPTKDRLTRFDLKTIAERWRAHPSPVTRAIGTLVFLAVLIAAPYALVSNWTEMLTLVQAAAYQVQGIAVLPPLVRISFFVVCLAVLAGLLYYAGGARPRSQKLTALSLASVPLLGVALSMATTLSYAEVPTRNIGIVASAPSSAEIFAAARGQSRYDGDNGVGIYEYDLSRLGFDRVALRRFVGTHNIRYLIVSSAMAPADIESLNDLISSRGLTIITTPEANADGFSDKTVGIFVSPEAEADRIEGQLVGDGTLRVLLLYARIPDQLDSFENRFRVKLARSRALNVTPHPTDDLRAEDPYLLPQLRASDTIVLADSGPHGIDMLRRIRALNPRARLISTSRVLDHGSLQTLQDLRVETILPWPVVEAFNRAAAGAAKGARVPSPIETASASATRLALLMERHLGHMRPHQIRQSMMANRAPWLEDLERFYGEVSFAEGRVPHLRVGLLRMSGTTATIPPPRTSQ